MANTATNKAKHSFAMNYILAAVKNKNGKAIEKSELFEGAGISRAGLDRCIKELKDTYPKNFKRISEGHRASFYWKEDEPAVTPAAPKDRFDYTKTEEGYSDPTAALAMSHLNDGEHKPGDIFDAMHSDGTSSEVIVINACSYRATVVPFIRTFSDIYDNEISEMCPIVDSGRVLGYFNPGRITQKPLKYLGDKIGELTENELRSVRENLNKYLALIDYTPKTVVVEKVVEKEVPVEVEKIVEKVVEKEVPVEVIKEIPVEKVVEKIVEVPKVDDDYILKVLSEQRASIYKDILEKLIAAKIV